MAGHDADRLCERLGDLAASAAPAADRLPDARQWAAIGERLDGARVAGRRWLALASCAVVLIGLAGWLVARRPLGYRLQGCQDLARDHDQGADCSVSPGDIVFSDGTRVLLQARTRVRIEALDFGRGAALRLDEGRATLAVVHRARAHWSVLAGPFRVEVTGTRFSVDWSSARAAIEVAVEQGEVKVSGGPLAQTALLHPGERLTADARPAMAKAEERAEDKVEDKVDEGAPPEAPAPATAQDRPTKNAALAPVRHARPGRQHVEAKGLAGDGSSTAQTGPGIAPPRPSFLPGTDVPRPSHATTDDTEEAVPAPRPASASIMIGPDGQLAGAMTGMTWIARGTGTTLSAPVTHEEHTRLLPGANGLCTSGTVAGLRCVNENSPTARCNWDVNWGVAIGFNVKVGNQAWGAEAPKRVAVEFHGRSAKYRLNAHRKLDPADKNFCVDDYRSGQPVTPAMFKSRCWEGAGESLRNFSDVDLFNLQFESGMDYVAFHYCVSAIRIER